MRIEVKYKKEINIIIRIDNSYNSLFTLDEGSPRYEVLLDELYNDINKELGDDIELLKVIDFDTRMVLFEE